MTGTWLGDQKKHEDEIRQFLNKEISTLCHNIESPLFHETETWINFYNSFEQRTFYIFGHKNIQVGANLSQGILSILNLSLCDKFVKFAFLQNVGWGFLS